MCTPSTLLTQPDYKQEMSVLGTPASDRHAALEQMWEFISQANPRNSCCNLWDLPAIPSVGQCFLVAHAGFPPVRYVPSVLKWHISGPRRHCCFYDALEAMRPSPVHREKSCERQIMFDTLDPSDGVIVGPPEDVDYLCEGCASAAEPGPEARAKLKLPNGWTR